MGYAFCIAPCYGCKRAFSFNPNSVPSLMIDGVKEPICRSCINRINPVRKENGLDEIVPLPDAYEPVDEKELIW